MEPTPNDDFTLNITYQALSDIKTYTASGAAASLTPDGSINLFFYTERRAFPKSATVKFIGDKYEESDDIFEDENELIREITQSILISKETALFLAETFNGIAQREAEESEEAKGNKQAKNDA